MNRRAEQFGGSLVIVCGGREEGKPGGDRAWGGDTRVWWGRGATAEGRSMQCSELSASKVFFLTGESRRN